MFIMNLVIKMRDEIVFKMNRMIEEVRYIQLEKRIVRIKLSNN